MLTGRRAFGGDDVSDVMASVLKTGSLSRPAGFAAPLGLKDMHLASHAAEARRVPMPLLSLLRDHLLETLAKEGEDIDWSGIARTTARNAGL